MNIFSQLAAEASETKKSFQNGLQSLPQDEIVQEAKDFAAAVKSTMEPRFIFAYFSLLVFAVGVAYVVISSYHQ